MFDKILLPQRDPPYSVGSVEHKKARDKRYNV